MPPALETVTAAATGWTKLHSSFERSSSTVAKPTSRSRIHLLTAEQSVALPIAESWKEATAYIG